jgi:AraC family transcriptional regulator
MLSCEGDWAGVLNSFDDGPVRQVGLAGGKIKIIPAGRTIHAKWKPGRRRYMLVFIDPKKLSDVLAREHADAPLSLSEQVGLTNKDLESVLNAVRKELLIPDLCRLTLGNALAAQLMVGLVRFSSKRQRNARSIGGGLSPRHIRAVLELVDRRYSEKLSLRDLAAATGLSQSHFSHAFRQTTGKSPYQFLGTPLTGGNNLLVEGNPDLTGVAIRAGFSGSSHFATAFRRAIGMSPREWRKQAQGSAALSHDQSKGKGLSIRLSDQSLYRASTRQSSSGDPVRTRRIQ